MEDAIISPTRYRIDARVSNESVKNAYTQKEL